MRDKKIYGVKNFMILKKFIVVKMQKSKIRVVIKL